MRKIQEISNYRITNLAERKWRNVGVDGAHVDGAERERIAARLCTDAGVDDGRLLGEGFASKISHVAIGQ